MIAPLIERPSMTIFSTENGFGYHVQGGIMSIRQDYNPVFNGAQSMTLDQATKLGNFIADKTFAGLSAGVTAEQVDALWNDTKTVQELIDAEIAILEAE